MPFKNFLIWGSCESSEFFLSWLLLRCFLLSQIRVKLAFSHFFFFSAKLTGNLIISVWGWKGEEEQVLKVTLRGYSFSSENVLILVLPKYGVYIKKKKKTTKTKKDWHWPLLYHAPTPARAGAAPGGAAGRGGCGERIGTCLVAELSPPSRARPRRRRALPAPLPLYRTRLGSAVALYISLVIHGF